MIAKKYLGILLVMSLALSGCSDFLQKFVNRSSDNCRAPAPYNRPSLKLLGRVATINNVYKAAVSGHYAYLNIGQNISIADVSDPSNPRILSTLAIPSADWSVDGVVSGNTWFVTSGSDGIRSIDVSNPLAPAFVNAAPGAPGWANTILLKSPGRAIVSYGNRGVVFMNVSNISALAQTFAFSAGANVGPSGEAIVGDYGYFAYGGGAGVVNKEMRIYDISSTTSSTLMSTFPSATGVNDVAVSGNYAYLATVGAGLQVVDVSNVSSPQLVGTYSSTNNFYTVRVENNLAVVLTSNNDMRLLDVSQPTNPVLVGTYAFTTAALGSWARAELVCHNIYVGDATNSGLLIFDMYGGP